MPKQDYGDAPIEPEYFELMGNVARAIDELFNGEAKGKNRTTGFFLLVFPFGETEGRCNYISNGADRRDIIKLLREQADKFDEQLKKNT